MNVPREVAKFAERAQQAGEEVHYFVQGWTGSMMETGAERQRNGHLILTNQRIVFYLKGLFTEVCESIRLDKITSIDRKRGIHGQIIIRAAATILHFKTFSMQSLDRLHEQLEEHAAKAATLVTQGSKTRSPPSIADQIERLALLRDKGVITEDEFLAGKAKLLS